MPLNKDDIKTWMKMRFPTWSDGKLNEVLKITWDAYQEYQGTQNLEKFRDDIYAIAMKYKRDGRYVAGLPAARVIFSELKDSAESPGRGGSGTGEGYLTARAFLIEGSHKIEVSAILISPENFPEILVNKSIPFTKLAVPATKYYLVASYDHPGYGKLLAPKVRRAITVSPGKEKRVKFNFEVPKREGGGGPGGGGGEGGSGKIEVRGDIKVKPDTIKISPDTIKTEHTENIHVDVDVDSQKGMFCPACLSFSPGEKYPLHPIAGTRGTEFHCDRCQNNFIRNARGELVLNHIGEDLPEVCPYCHEEIDQDEKKMPHGHGVVHRLYCVNPNCVKGPGHTQPWFIDLSDSDYHHWLELRKKRKLAGIARLKLDMRQRGAIEGFNIDNPKTSRGRAIKRELKRITGNVNEHGFTDVFLERLGIDKATARSKYGLDPDEPKHFSENARQSFMKSLGREAKEEDKFKGDEEGAKWGSKKEYEDQQGTWNKRLANLYKGTEKTSFSIVMALVGIVAGAILGWPFLVAFACWAGRNMLPNPKAIKLTHDWERGENLGFGSLWARGKHFDNRYSTGIAATKGLLKIAMLFFFGWGFFTLDVPFRGILLLVFAFMGYFSLPAEFTTDEPYKFVEGLWRVPMAFLIFYIFYSVFESAELGVLSLAFFLILPIATEKENLARAIGHLGSGISANYEMFDKVLFIVLMGIGLYTVLGGAGMNLDVATIAGSIFLPFWIVALIGGVFSPAQTRPYTGVLVLILVFVFYAGGAGEQIVGYGFFGEWWPTVHNAFGTITEPMGDLFSTLGETFGQTWTLFTNPMGFAQNIMDGSFEKNPHGPAGSFGVEIESLMVPAIYPGTTAMMTFNIKNVGPEKAKLVNITVSVPDEFKDSMTIGPDNGKYGTKEIEQEYIIPLFFTIDTDCDTLMKSGSLKLTDRNKYIRVNVSVEYDYEVSSWMPLTIISEHEWRDRSQKGTFAISKVGSHISTSPARLSIGSFDQPLIGGENRRYYLGFNLTSAEGKNSAIDWDSVEVTFDFPDDLMKYGGTVMTPTCNPKATTTGPPYVWNEFEDYPARAIFCTFPSTPNPDDPSVTYYVRANATFRFTKWETKDTLFAFSDVCGGGVAPVPGTVTADRNCCNNIKTGRDVTGAYIGGSGEGTTCDEGWGGCRSDVPTDCKSGLECRAVDGISGDICCRSGGSLDDKRCRDIFVDVFTKGQLYDIYCSPV